MTNPPSVPSLDVEACKHDWGWEPLKLSTNVCDPKPVVCVKCGRRRAYKRSDAGKLREREELR